MGAIVLIRQPLLDAQCYKQAQHAYSLKPAQPKPETNESLEALGTALEQDMPFIFEAGSTQDIR